MKCPYAVNRRVTTQITFDCNDEGAQTTQQSIEINSAEFVPCLEKECGAWEDGRCRYRGIE